MRNISKEKEKKIVETNAYVRVLITKRVNVYFPITECLCKFSLAVFFSLFQEYLVGVFLLLWETTDLLKGRTDKK